MNEPMKRPRFWYGVIKDGDDGGVVLIDLEDQEKDSPERVKIFNFKRNESLTYMKSIVRRRLRPIDAHERSLISAVTSAYLSFRYPPRKPNYDYDDWAYDREGYDMRDWEDIGEGTRDRHEFLTDFENSSSRSEEDGWFYDDRD